MLGNNKFYNLDMKVEQWFDFLDENFGFRKIEKKYIDWIDSKDWEKEMIEDSLNYSFDYETLLNYFRDCMNPPTKETNAIMRELEKYRLELLESKKSSRKSLKEKKVNYDLVEYEVGVMLNKLGVKSWDFSNEENCEKIEELNDIVFNLVNVLPKL